MSERERERENGTDASASACFQSIRARACVYTREERGEERRSNNETTQEMRIDGNDLFASEIPARNQLRGVHIAVVHADMQMAPA